MTRVKRDERPADRNLREAMEIAKWTAQVTCQCVGKQRNKCVTCVARRLVKRIESRPGMPPLAAFDTETVREPHEWVPCVDDRKCNLVFNVPGDSYLCLDRAVAICRKKEHGHLTENSRYCEQARCARHVPKDAIQGVG